MDSHGLNNGLPCGRWIDRDYFALKEMKLPRLLKFCLMIYIRMLEKLLLLKKELLTELEVLSQKERYKFGVAKKKSSPGIGWQTAIRLTLE